MQFRAVLATDGGCVAQPASAAQATLTDQDTFRPGGFRWNASTAARMLVGG